MPNRIFTYWQNPPGGDIPPYILLCLQTWYNNIPELELTVLNPYNLHEWIDRDFNMQVFASLSPAAQSDVAAFAVLAKNGGIFMDADTIITKNIFEEIDRLSADTDSVYFFGDPSMDAPHLAFIAAFAPENPFLRACAIRESELINELLILRPPITWSTFGNDILGEVRKDAQLNARLRILDRTETGAILESSFFDSGDKSQDYYDMYFIENDVSLDEVAAKIKFGLVMLHNSWTPKAFKTYDLEAVVNTELMISQLLRYALGESFFE